MLRSYNPPEMSSTLGAAEIYQSFLIPSGAVGRTAQSRDLLFIGGLLKKQISPLGLYAPSVEMRELSAEKRLQSLRLTRSNSNNRLLRQSPPP